MKEIFINTIIALVSILIFSSCSNSRYLSVNDDSYLSSSKEFFYRTLKDSMNYRYNNIKSYYSKKTSISADGIPLYNSVNATFSIDSTDNFASKIYLPFPLIELGRIKISPKFLYANSKQLNISINTDRFPNSILFLIKSALYGVVPEAYHFFGENDFSKFNVYIENNKYVLSKQASLTSFINIFINPDMSLSSLNACFDNIFLSFDCSKYTTIDGFDIPLSLNLHLNNGNDDLKAQISIKNVSLNNYTSLDF